MIPLHCTITRTQAAEYIEERRTAHEIQMLRNLLPELTVTIPPPTTIQAVNKGAPACVKGNRPTKKPKNINIRYYHVQEMQNRKVIATSYLPSTELQAEELTKPKPYPKLLVHLEKLRELPLSQAFPRYRSIITNMYLGGLQ